MIDWAKLTALMVLVSIFPFIFLTDYPLSIFMLWVIVFIFILFTKPKKLEPSPEPDIRNTLILPDDCIITINVTKDERNKITKSGRSV